MTTFHIDSAAVDAAALAARGTIARLQAEILALHANLSGLQASWTGPAATAFQGVVARWRHTQSRLESELATINEALALASRQYADIELAHVRMFQ
jgi:WXG100 family type VII secretion target